MNLETERRGLCLGAGVVKTGARRFRDLAGVGATGGAGIDWSQRDLSEGSLIEGGIGKTGLGEDTKRSHFHSKPYPVSWWNWNP